MSVVRQSIVARVNHILGTYCKGAVDKKGDKILAVELEGTSVEDAVTSLTAIY